MTASDRIEELKKRYDENPRRFFAPLANEYRKAGDLEQAIALCQTHLAEQPSNMNGHVVYGQALYDSGRFDEAKGTFETALMLDPENLIALRHLGDIACANGANHEAREWYERVLDADPRNDAIIALLAHLAAEDGKSHNAEASPLADPGASAHTPEAIAASRAVTPLSRTPVSDPTPIVPIEAVTTVRAPAVSMFTPERVEARADTVAPPPSASAVGLPRDPQLDAVFADAEEIHFGTPTDALPAVPVWPAAQANDESFETQSDLVMDPFAEPESAPEPTFEAAPEPTVESAAEPVMEFVLEPAFEPRAEAEVEPALEASAQLEDALVDEAAYDSKPEPPAEPFVTETMAELYLQQGFAAEALDVYRKLSAAAPMDERLRERVRRLEHGDRAPVEPGWAPPVEPDPAPLDELQAETPRSTPSVDAQPEPAAEAARAVRDTVPAAATSARSYFAALAARRAVRADDSSPADPAPAPHESAPASASPVDAPSGSPESLDELFAGGAVSADDESLALAIAQVAGAAEMGGAAVRGKPTAAATTELSLDSVFREPEPRPSTPVSRQSQTLRFDQFFAPAAEEPAVGDPPSGAPSGEPGSPAELQQFQSWLTRLKQP